SADTIGWCPVGERSTMARRRCPRRTTLLDHVPASSGPRRCSRSRLAANRSGGGRTPPLSNTPTIPHTHVLFSLQRKSGLELESWRAHPVPTGVPGSDNWLHFPNRRQSSGPL